VVVVEPVQKKEGHPYMRVTQHVPAAHPAQHVPRWRRHLRYLRPKWF
jgi:hypothetical protein